MGVSVRLQLPIGMGDAILGNQFGVNCKNVKNLYSIGSCGLVAQSSQPSCLEQSTLAGWQCRT